MSSSSWKVAEQGPCSLSTPLTIAPHCKAGRPAPNTGPDFSANGPLLRSGKSPQVCWGHSEAPLRTPSGWGNVFPQLQGVLSADSPLFSPVWIGLTNRTLPKATSPRSNMKVERPSFFPTNQDKPEGPPQPQSSPRSHLRPLL